MNPETILALLWLIIMGPAGIVFPNLSQYYKLFCKFYYYGDCGNLEEMVDASHEAEPNPGQIVT